MDIEYTKEIVRKALLLNHMTQSVDDNRTSLTVRFTDNTYCIIDLHTSLDFHENFSKQTIQEKKVIDSYFATHDRNDFLEDIYSLAKESPGVYFLFLILTKLKELNVITLDMAELIINNVSGCENELNNFFKVMLHL